MHLLGTLVISRHFDNPEISVGRTIAVSLRQNLHDDVPEVAAQKVSVSPGMARQMGLWCVS